MRPHQKLEIRTDTIRVSDGTANGSASRMVSGTLHGHREAAQRALRGRANGTTASVFFGRATPRVIFEVKNGAVVVKQER